MKNKIKLANQVPMDNLVGRKTGKNYQLVLKDWTIGGVCKEVILDDIANAKIFLTKEEILPSYHIN